MNPVKQSAKLIKAMAKANECADPGEAKKLIQQAEKINQELNAYDLRNL
jgi:hypothetical protein